ncbi:MAG: pantoate--beta-alanine ligase [Solirubrobacteraceae bacterium]
MIRASTAPASAPPEAATLPAQGEIDELRPLAVVGEGRSTPLAPTGADRVPRIVRSRAELRSLLEPRRRAGACIGLVPTMGALHAGHLSLIAEARERCDVVVVSIFVNPTQFDEGSDLLAYPRHEQRDVALAGQAGADLVFAPAAEEIYPQGFSTFVEVGQLTQRLEGAIRGAQHFRGVTTVVCKLLNIVRPELAFFGQKDAQQVAVVTRMCDDLDLDVQIVALPTVREDDGLALSSRNVRLDERQRARSLALVSALRAAGALVAAGERSASRLLSAAAAELERFAVQPEYVALVDARSFEDVETLDGNALLLLAARVGSTRLIDNAMLRPDAADQRKRPDAADQLESAGAPDARRRAGDEHDTRGREAIAACSA